MRLDEIMVPSNARNLEKKNGYSQWDYTEIWFKTMRETWIEERSFLM